MTDTPASPPFRVGQAFDVHAHSDDPDRVLILGGIRFEGERGLAGNSDADIVAHVCCDAILGAAGLGDIGQMFPDTDPALEGPIRSTCCGGRRMPYGPPAGILATSTCRSCLTDRNSVP